MNKLDKIILCLMFLLPAGFFDIAIFYVGLQMPWLLLLFPFCIYFTIVICAAILHDYTQD